MLNRLSGEQYKRLLIVYAFFLLLLTAALCIEIRAIILYGGRLHSEYLIDIPNEYKISKPKLAGVTGVTVRSSNGHGIRTANDPPDNYDILMLGSSTTTCRALDDRETTAYHLSQRSNYTVGIVGKDGFSADRIAAAFEVAVLQMSPDLWIIMPGAPDLGITIRSGNLTLTAEDYSNSFLRSLVFYGEPGQRRDLYFGSVALDHWYDTLPEIEYNAATETENQRHYWSAIEIDNEPSIESEISTYSTNILHIVDTAERYHADVVFVTQPTVWSPDLASEDQNLLAAGLGQDGGNYWHYTTDILINMRDKFNGALLDICEQQSVDCLDLASVMNGRAEYYYDDWHFNEYGAEIAAQTLFKFIQSR